VSKHSLFFIKAQPAHKGRYMPLILYNLKQGLLKKHINTSYNWLQNWTSLLKSIISLLSTCSKYIFQ